MKKLSDWEKIGVIGIDAGLCWIGDPCYILHRKRDDKSKNIGENWTDFCNKIGNKDTVQFNYDGGNRPGLGVVVSTRDGEYPVFIKRDLKTNKIVRIKIKFT